MYFILAAFRSHSRKLIVYSAALAFILVGLALVFLPVIGVSLEFIFLNPAAFTGRGFIWDMLLEAVKKKSLGGIGYQSVFQVGNAGALVGMTRNSFYDTLAHAHNAYLEIYVSIGLIGLLLALLVIVVLPIRQVYRMGPQFSDLRPVLFTILAFVYMHDILESGLLDRDRPTWLMLLMVYGIARAATTKVSVHLPRASLMGQRSEIVGTRRLDRSLDATTSALPIRDRPSASVT
jgi:O-antigen ligase